ncbi:Uncharacterised protein [Mycobacterium tuberculosis]|uniref:Uncharacterized protein n=1 Tax=Mycobacterium tuberculosis TaxID=1773 RepID=A0A655IQ41_MYCTX|nr:hypothetical protein IU12_10130 [Mycobacterium tuberculosis]CFE55162.1 Uncharacterised protein [Mycobacterium tuberculosis]CKP09456.1 Uncharacterised protein [Mycobacterium tuberculosis]CKP36276.1 Uncharacterised protein [Mycobacterium tuberculosis]CKS37409.1 Uncharacterised protein [Mycobacterium tuberculosis]
MPNAFMVPQLRWWTFTGGPFASGATPNILVVNLPRHRWDFVPLPATRGRCGLEKLVGHGRPRVATIPL